VGLLAAEIARKTRSYKPSRARRYIGGKRLDLGRVLGKGDVEVFAEIADNTAEIAYAVRCPWWRQHTGEDVTGTRALQYPSEATYFVCEHAHCEGRTWQDFYRAIRRPVRASNFLEVNISYGG